MRISDWSSDVCSSDLDRPIDYKTERFEEIVPNLDAVLAAMGGEVLYRSISNVKPGGRVVCLPSTTKADPKAIPLPRERQTPLVWPMMQPRQAHAQTNTARLGDGKLRVELNG